MIEVEVTINTGAGQTTYKVMVPEVTPARAAAVLGSSIELGCALLDAPFRKDTEDDGVQARTVQ